MNVRIPKCVYYRMKIWSSFQLVRKYRGNVAVLRKFKKVLFSVCKSYNIDLSGVFSLIDKLINNAHNDMLVYIDKDTMRRLSYEVSRVINAIR